MCQGEGLGVLSAAILLAGEMAGSGVLALPAAMTGTGGVLGMALIIIFTINSLYSGTRLGLCWIILEERYEEYRGQVRDPYPAIGERAIGKWGRWGNDDHHLNTAINELLQSDLPVGHRPHALWRLLRLHCPHLPAAW